MAADLDPLAVELDGALATLARRVDLLLDVTPVDAEDPWRASVSAGHRRDLDLRYRPVGTDIAGVRAGLAELPLDALDPGPVRDLLVETAEDLELQLRLVEARCTPSFLDRSRAIWGTADDDLVALALELLGRLEPSPPTETIDPEGFATRAQAEVDLYRRRDPALVASVAVRADVPSLMVVRRDLLVGDDSVIPEHRAEALVQHEVGTHLLTAVNGGHQPLTLLEHGLAGYEETQEALGVLSEHLVAGIDADRMRTLAGRAVAVRRLTDGADFADLQHELQHVHGFAERAAWTIAMRVVRGGGLTKDVIYLRGLVELVDHLAAGGALEPLLVGKLHLRQVPVVERLLAEGTLRPPHLRPRWLEGDGPAARLAALRAGDDPVATWPRAA